jgi:hypothetical protein
MVSKSVFGLVCESNLSVWIVQHENRTVIEVNTSYGEWSYDLSESGIEEMPDILNKAYVQLHKKRSDKNILANKVKDVLGIQVTEEGIERLKKIFNE